MPHEAPGGNALRLTLSLKCDSCEGSICVFGSRYKNKYFFIFGLRFGKDKRSHNVPVTNTNPRVTFSSLDAGGCK